MSTRIVAGSALVALLAGLAPGARPLEGAPGTVRVAIHDFEFAPTPRTIAAGTRVTWANDDDELHTVTSASGLFASPGLEKGDTFSYTFAAPGTYAYFCSLHPNMTSTIRVE